MYIEPNTTIRILKDVPIDNSYKNTLYFSNRDNQYDYFVSKTKETLVNNTYQRVGLGVMRIQRPADKLYGCNYLMFQNTSYGNKWFYAFITNVEYINNAVSEIKFEIDVIQTWLLDCDIKESFVEREHSSSDEIGDNILPEPVELGEYVYTGQNVLTKALEPMAVIVAVTDIEGGVTNGEIYDGVYSGVKYYAFNSFETDKIDAFLASFVQSPDSIVSMYMCPAIVCAEGSINAIIGKPLEKTTSGWSVELGLDVNFIGDFSGYTPKNNKLYTYPYNLIHINNNNGASLDLRREFFSGEPTVKLDSCLSMPVRITCRPFNYKGVEGAFNNEVISLENYPMCSWNMDAYKVWLSQNMVPMAIKTASTIVKSAVSIGTASMNPLTAPMGYASAINSGVSLVEEFATNNYTASIQADMCKGNINNGNVNISHKMQNFFVSRCHITKDYARYIDSFFTVFGYACRRVKKPNISSRPHWNYVKTVESNIIGTAPSDDLAKISNLFDRGITFWKKGSEVGNYSLDNSP